MPFRPNIEHTTLASVIWGHTLNERNNFILNNPNTNYIPNEQKLFQVNMTHHAKWDITTSMPSRN